MPWYLTVGLASAFAVFLVVATLISIRRRTKDVVIILTMGWIMVALEIVIIILTAPAS